MFQNSLTNENNTLNITMQNYKLQQLNLNIYPKFIPDSLLETEIIGYS